MIWLVRHCETEWNRAGVKFGRLDPPLDNAGLKDAARLATRFDNLPVNVVVTSPLARARMTGEAIATRQGVPLTVVPDLIEADHGPAEGMHHLARAARFPDMTTIREPDDLIAARASRALQAVPPGAVVVTHKGVLRALGVPGPLEFGTVREWNPNESP